MRGTSKPLLFYVPRLLIFYPHGSYLDPNFNFIFFKTKHKNGHFLFSVFYNKIDDNWSPYVPVNLFLIFRHRNIWLYTWIAPNKRAKNFDGKRIDFKRRLLIKEINNNWKTKNWPKWKKSIASNLKTILGRILHV